MVVAKKLPKCSWHLAQLKPNCAMIAQRNLVRQGFEVFLPLESRTKVVRGKFVERNRPFFPGYLFVGTTDPAGMSHSIRSTYGISQLVCFGNTPAIVPQGLVEALKMRCDKDFVMQQDPQLDKGARVRLTNGPFAGLLGEVMNTPKDRRVLLLLNVMGQRTKVSIARSDVRALA